ncbi:class I SAM-dependent methyltransferase [Nocardioides carbamazepini]|uniref:class I SAM-dependent methyltransferase n=1 Tax=Nocardioides carbamazepini TaxID=2854259 RepID=UPI00214A1992|nr:class I SAM-dependent methyltransferase [Nocardioides carbamazepini]MCR1783734.1 class I SAM-dependent methyltransferase [Nocardioides carbamazepini]
MTDDPAELELLYRNRFARQSEMRQDLWEVLCRDFFQRWVPESSTVLDIAAGSCEFINNITARRKLAVDLNPDLVHKAGPDVEATITRSDAMDHLADQSVDRVFISNFFEHVPREVIMSTLVEVRRVLRPDGKLLVLQPNVRYCARDYWMFFDHITPVDDRALIEAFAAADFDVELNIPRFLPYTTKSRLPSGPRLVSLYLKVPLAWKVMGAQAFMVGAPRPA